MEILLGADPELFVKKDGEYISAHGMIKGDKENPHPVRNGAVQIDGTALEFNIEPADSAEDWVMKLDDVMSQLKAMVPGYDVVAEPVAYYGEEYMSQIPDDAKILGCSPDFNAWADGKENNPPNAHIPFRTAAGHVHIGFGEFTVDDNHVVNCIPLVKQLDFYLGLRSVLYDDNKDRRTLYGAAGAFRPKPYGLEYRVLSNKWLESKELMRKVYDDTITAINELLKGNRVYEKYGDDVKNAIDRGDKTLAAAMLHKEGLL